MKYGPGANMEQQSPNFSDEITVQRVQFGVFPVEKIMPEVTTFSNGGLCKVGGIALEGQPC